MYNDIRLEVNIVKTRHIEVGRYRCMMANEYITVGSISYEN